jgi:hypothetical protein
LTSPSALSRRAEAFFAQVWVRHTRAMVFPWRGQAPLQSPDEPVDQVLLRFAQTADREFAVENDGGQLVGTLALLDLVLTEQ